MFDSLSLSLSLFPSLCVYYNDFAECFIHTFTLHRIQSQFEGLIYTVKMVSHLTGYLYDYSNELYVLVCDAAFIEILVYNCFAVLLLSVYFFPVGYSFLLAICTLKINVYKSHQ